MPYIKQLRRKALVNGDLPMTVGELNYLVTLELIGRWEENPAYDTIAQLHLEFFLQETPCPFLRDLAVLNPRFTRYQVSSAAQLAYLEFYRRVGSRYEDLRAQENGDMYRLVSFKSKTSAGKS